MNAILSENSIFSLIVKSQFSIIYVLDPEGKLVHCPQVISKS